MPIQREPVPAGGESVWDYPRPPRLEPCSKHLKIVFGGETIAETTRGYRVLETSHPPVYYFPPDDVCFEFVKPTGGGSYCEWKGKAAYFNAVVGGKTAERVGWSYPDPVGAFRPIAGYLAFYAGPMDACTVDGELVTPQPGGFYGGWVTRDIAGPFKGSPGTMGW